MPQNKDFEVKNGLRVAGGLINANSGLVALGGDVTVANTLTTTGNTTVGGALSASGNVTVSGPLLTYKSATTAAVALGTITGGGTAALNYNSGSIFSATFQGATTLNFTNLPTGYWEISMVVSNAGLGSIAIQVNGSASSVIWVKGDGTSSTTFSSMGVSLQASGTNHLMFWGIGNTIYGKAA